MKPRLRDASSRIDVDVHRMYTHYTGAKDDLIAEGLATEDMFPAGRKRKTCHLGPDIPVDEGWAIDRKKGGIYQLTRWHDAVRIPEPPPQWNPLQFKAKVSAMFETCDVIVSCANGDFEQSACGKRVHRLSDADLDKLKRLREQTREVLANAKVERGYRATLTPIK